MRFCSSKDSWYELKEIIFRWKLYHNFLINVNYLREIYTVSFYTVSKIKHENPFMRL